MTTETGTEMKLIMVIMKSFEIREKNFILSKCGPRVYSCILLICNCIYIACIYVGLLPV